MPRDARVLVLGPSLLASQELVRDAAAEGHLGWRASTLDRFAVEQAAAALAAVDRIPATRLASEAVCARVVAEHGAEGTLGRFAAVAQHPGLPRALARTFEELRLAELSPDRCPDDLRPLARGYAQGLAAAGLADRADVLWKATEALGASGAPLPPVLLLDVPVASATAETLVAAIAGRTPRLLAVTPHDDTGGAERLARALAVEPEVLEGRGTRGLDRLQSALFADVTIRGEEDASVALFSAPGESRECVEIARRIRSAAGKGIPFDRMAVLMRAPSAYRDRLTEALRRAGIPSWSARGSRRPDPAGRAFLALLGCRAEGLSARRFSEFLSLGEAAPRPVDPEFVQADDDLLTGAPVPTVEERALPFDTGRESRAAGSGADDAGPDTFANTIVPSPRRWERLLVDAAVIGGRDRWERRLDGLDVELQKRREALLADDEESPRLARTDRLREDLGRLRAFALPLLDELEALPDAATWGAWIELLGSLASHALATPDRVLRLLAELRPMAVVGPVSFTEVRLVLQDRLRDLVDPETDRRYGKVFVGSIDEARGLAFDLVFAPGLTERVFPQKVVEDPILLDAVRESIDGGLRTREARVAEERAALQHVCGAASSGVVLSWSRLDEMQARPRVPSFYGLEVLRATLGALPGFDILERHADHAGAARLGWPAPEDPADAIDEAEHDLAVLRDLMNAGASDDGRGSARYLLSANVHLARALRARGRRWGVAGRFTEADGLVAPRPEAVEALAAHQLSARSYSPTALQQYAQCPYKFLLYAIHRLSPREEPEHIEEIDALSRGSLIHDVQYEFLTELRESGRLPLDPDRIVELWDLLEPVRERNVARFAEKLSPAIPRVWEDAMSEIRADLRQWLRRMADEPEWVPDRFELSFGLAEREAQDPGSSKDPIDLDCGIRMRGAIDLIERGPGGLRVTDYKTGKVNVKQDAVIQGGEVLQPVLYALAVEKAFPNDKVLGGRLWFCTARGGFQDRETLLNQQAREAADQVARAVGSALESGFLPAAPRKDACRWCDFKSVCGPHEEARTQGGAKPREQIADLLKLREAP